MTPGRVRRRLSALWALAGVLLLVGAVVFSLSPPAGFGWFAYQPWSSDDVAVVVSGAVLMSPLQVLGVALVALALALCAGVGGYAVGARGTSRRSAPPR
ncbi:hypothetical protein [Quadrisphaera sp. KR29]|uniref:hypothetical protein n=1 Tax=Quadrisphaera sp. KR29 TaxID=3461391 RepID=UPI0040447089